MGLGSSNLSLACVDPVKRCTYNGLNIAPKEHPTTGQYPYNLNPPVVVPRGGFSLDAPLPNNYRPHGIKSLNQTLAERLKAWQQSIPIWNKLQAENCPAPPGGDYIECCDTTNFNLQSRASESNIDTSIPILGKSITNQRGELIAIQMCNCDGAGNNDQIKDCQLKNCSDPAYAPITQYQYCKIGAGFLPSNKPNRYTNQYQAKNMPPDCFPLCVDDEPTRQSIISEPVTFGDVPMPELSFSNNGKATGNSIAPKLVFGTGILLGLIALVFLFIPFPKPRR